MKKTTLTLIIVLVALALGYYYYQGSSDNSMMAKDEVMAPSSPVGMEMEKSEDKMMADVAEGDAMMKKEAGSYVPYAEGVLEPHASARRVLFFYASWCPTCKPVDAELTKRVAEIPADVAIIRVNYNDPDTDEAEKDLAKKYGVTYQHTYVEIDSNGDKVQSWNGGSLDMILEKLK